MFTSMRGVSPSTQRSSAPAGSLYGVEGRSPIKRPRTGGRYGLIYEENRRFSRPDEGVASEQPSLQSNRERNYRPVAKLPKVRFSPDSVVRSFDPVNASVSEYDYNNNNSVDDRSNTISYEENDGFIISSFKSFMRKFGF